MPRLRIPHRGRFTLLKNEQGSALLEFAIVLPLLVVFVVGIYDFSGAFNQKLKMEQAAQEGAIVAGAQPMSDIQTDNTNPDSLQPVVVAVFNSLAAGGFMPNANTGGGCIMPPPIPVHAPGTLKWVYAISGCSSVRRRSTDHHHQPRIGRPAAPPMAVTTAVTVEYPYHWRFNSVIQLLIPGRKLCAENSVAGNCHSPQPDVRMFATASIKIANQSSFHRIATPSRARRHHPSGGGVHAVCCRGDGSARDRRGDALHRAQRSAIGGRWRGVGGRARARELGDDLGYNRRVDAAAEALATTVATQVATAMTSAAETSSRLVVK